MAWTCLTHMLVNLLLRSPSVLVILKLLQWLEQTQVAVQPKKMELVLPLLLTTISEELNKISSGKVASLQILESVSPSLITKIVIKIGVMGSSVPWKLDQLQL